MFNIHLLLFIVISLMFVVHYFNVSIAVYCSLYAANLFSCAPCLHHLNDRILSYLLFIVHHYAVN